MKNRREASRFIGIDSEYLSSDAKTQEEQLFGEILNASVSHRPLTVLACHETILAIHAAERDEEAEAEPESGRSETFRYNVIRMLGLCRDGLTENTDLAELAYCHAVVAQLAQDHHAARRLARTAKKFLGFHLTDHPEEMDKYYGQFRLLDGIDFRASTELDDLN